MFVKTFRNCLLSDDNVPGQPDIFRPRCSTECENSLFPGHLIIFYFIYMNSNLDRLSRPKIPAQYIFLRPVQLAVESFLGTKIFDELDSIVEDEDKRYLFLFFSCYVLPLYLFTRSHVS